MVSFATQLLPQSFCLLHKVQIEQRLLLNQSLKYVLGKMNSEDSEPVIFELMKLHFYRISMILFLFSERLYHMRIVY